MALEWTKAVRKGISQKDFLDDITAYAESLRTIIEANVEGFDPDPAASAARRRRVLDGDFEFFCRTYFPHYVKGEPSEMHKYAFKRLPEMDAIPTSVHEWTIAPRGEAKSTIVTQLGRLFRVVTGRKHYMIVVMASLEQAVMMIEAIASELESNPRLAMDFPEACGQGRVWKADVIVTANNIKIEGAGVGKKLRGKRHGPYRVEETTLDDLENDENVKQVEQRNKLEGFIKKVIIPLGPPGGKHDIWYVGTVLHYDAVIVRISKNPMWTGRKFKSIIRFPDRMDLWDRWEEKARNDSIAEADAFYARQKDVMDAGSIVSWPTVRPIEFLMKLRLEMGVEEFNAEQQNDPIDDANAAFSTPIFWVSRLNNWLFYGSCDPSMGKAKSSSSDPSAILVGGFNRDTGVLDVIEASIRKRHPDIIIEDVIGFQREYRCMAWAVETVQFQEFFKDEMVKRSAAAGIPVPAIGVKNSTDKELRIETLQPHVKNGLIRFHPRLTTLLEQLRHWPSADHDDGPDALEMLWRLVLRRTAMAGGLQTFGKRSVGSSLQGYGVGQGGGGFGGFGGR